MISFEEALRITKDNNYCSDNYDYVKEYTNCFVFSIDGFESFGGFDSPCVVRKKDGKLFDISVYNLKSLDEGDELIQEGLIANFCKAN